MITRTCLLASLLLVFSSQDAFGQTFWIDSFETTGPTLGVGGTRAVSVGHANSTDGTNCAVGDYFFRTTMTGAGALGSGFDADFSAGADGSFIWRGEDLDACIVNPDTITWTGIDIMGMTGLLFSGRFAARDTQPFETTDRITVQWRIDAGALNDGLQFAPDGLGNLALDTNFDGTGDGAALTTTLTEFTFLMGATGASLDLVVTVSIDAGSEEFALDLFQVAGNGMVPVELKSFDIE
ncbi:MAG: hypothetical protein QNJ40_12215 [Xanthomonadales bacterium]|nr:hypothetical protein [Xanthomonadales bacterium]